MCLAMCEDYCGNQPLCRSGATPIAVEPLFGLLLDGGECRVSAYTFAAMPSFVWMGGVSAGLRSSFNTWTVCLMCKCIAKSTGNLRPWIGIAPQDVYIVYRLY
jgi:hypothetical protein